MTEVINSTKTSLDEYRNERNRQSKAVASTSETDAGDTASSTFTDAGFGEVSRSSETDNRSFLASTIEVVKAVLERSYTALLFLLSLYLAHPLIVQLTLLFLVLFIIYKLARRLGSRPQL